MKKDKEDIKRMFEFFEAHWKSKPHKCECCGKYLGSENKTIFHDHLLEKSKYPEYKYEMSNMYLVCLQCHDEKSRGFPKPNHKKAIEHAEKTLKNN